MGGRRSKSIREVFGKGNVPTKRALTSAIKKKDSEQMALSSFDLVFKSRETKSGLVKAIKLMREVAKESVKTEGMSKESSERFASKLWADMKDKEKLKTSSETDKVFVSSAAQVLRKRRKEDG